MCIYQREIEEGEGDRQTGRHRDRVKKQRERERERDRQTDRERDRETETQRERESEREREWGWERQTDKHNNSDRGTEKKGTIYFSTLLLSQSTEWQDGQMYGYHTSKCNRKSGLTWAANSGLPTSTPPCILKPQG